MVSDSTSLHELLAQAWEHHGHGRALAAEAVCRRILAHQPEQADALQLLAILSFQAGNQTQGIDLAHRSVLAAPQTLSFRRNLVQMLLVLGRQEHGADRFQEAAEAFDRALRQDPELVEAWNGRGVCLQRLDRLSEAEACFRRALLLAPEEATLHANLGNLLLEAQRFDEAAESHLQALARHPGLAESWRRLCVALREGGRMAQAEEALARAFALEPEAVENLLQRGHLRQAQEKPEEAMACYRQVLDREPGQVEALLQLGLLLYKEKRLDEAATAGERVARLAPEQAEGHLFLGNLYKEQGRIDEARASLTRSFALSPRPATAIRLATLLPVIPQSEEEIAASRLHYEAALDRLLASDLRLDNPWGEVGQTNQFFLSYQGAGNRALNEKLAGFYRAAAPNLAWEAPLPSPAGGRIKLGFVSRFFRRHTIGRFFRGVIAHLPREIFEVFVFFLPGKRDDLSRFIARQAAQAVELPGEFFQARETIARAGLDLLVFTDIGMEPFAYFLAHARLARVQCTLYGHPDTTGLPSLDWFLSNAACETDDADAHYSERLARLSGAHAYTYYFRPDPPAELPVAGPRVYLCAQSLFKIHPAMDAVFDAILQGDPQGEIHLFEGQSPHWTRLMQTRLKRRMRHWQRVRFLPTGPLPYFLGLVASAAALLDTFHFCGGNTSFDSFAVAAPVVTLPGPFMRGRQTLGLYRRMGWTELVAASPEEYVALALRLGRDEAFRRQARQELRQRSAVLFEDAGMVENLAVFFRQAAGFGVW